MRSTTSKYVQMDCPTSHAAQPKPSKIQNTRVRFSLEKEFEKKPYAGEERHRALHDVAERGKPSPVRDRQSREAVAAN